MESEIKELSNLFRISIEDMKEIIEAFHAEMNKGLAGQQSSLKMLPAYVDNPTGKEKGSYLALDLGGTNFRVLMVKLNGDGTKPEITSSKYTLTKEQISTTIEVLFDAVAEHLYEFMLFHKYYENYKLGFTFSFPINQTNIDEGKLTCWTWTKEFKVKDVEGEVVTLLREALQRRNIKNVEVVSLNNDTVGTQVARAYTDKNCDIGGIIGTGTNFCYREDVCNIKKQLSAYHKAKMIINVESGNFDKKLPVTKYDKILDMQSNDAKRQLEEKMVSGKYLGEITRLILLDLTEKGALFSGKLPDALKIRYEFQTTHMSSIENDQSVNLWPVRRRMIKMGIPNITFEEAKTIKDVCNMVSTRAARLAATILAAIVTRIDAELTTKHVIAIDGSIFYLYPGFRDRMERALEEIFGIEKALLIKMEHTEDGSGVGAAIIAAVAISGR